MVGKKLASKKPNPLKLQSVSVQIMALSELIAEAQGEITIDIETALYALSKELKGTTDLYGFLLKRLEVEADFLRSESQHYAEKCRKTKHGIENLKNRIKESMIEMDSQRLEGSRWGFLLKKSRQKAVLNEALFPSIEKRPDLWRSKTEYLIDKEVVLKRLQGGEKIEGAVLEEVHALTPIDMIPTIEAGRKPLKGSPE